MTNASCGCSKNKVKRYVSNALKSKEKCIDVCTTPICGTPDTLTLFAPIVYDELGINLCRNIPLTTPVPAARNPVAVRAQLLSTNFNVGEASTTSITRIPGRPNCYEINLTNLTFTFAITSYDEDGNAISTENVDAIYLPTNSTNPAYGYFNEETNPTNVVVEIFAPYGTAHATNTSTAPIIQDVGFTSTNNYIKQGLNMVTIPKVLDFDVTSTTPTVTMGISIYIKSVYFTQYLVPHRGRAIVPKADISNASTVCQDFVYGDLLDYEIKPLELAPPKCDYHLKKDCNEDKECISESELRE